MTFVLTKQRDLAPTKTFRDLSHRRGMLPFNYISSSSWHGTTGVFLDHTIKYTDSLFDLSVAVD
jgi:hypothetical protein